VNDKKNRRLWKGQFVMVQSNFFFAIFIFDFRKQKNPCVLHFNTWVF